MIESGPSLMVDDSVCVCYVGIRPMHMVILQHTKCLLLVVVLELVSDLEDPG